jgi:uncharacterized protein (DUF983 family)
MDYKCSCPKCATRMSRWYIFCQPTIYHRCRNCGARYRLPASGWLIAFIPIPLALLLHFMAREQIISRQIALGLLILLLVITVLLLPYFLTVRLDSREQVQSQDNAV